MQHLRPDPIFDIMPQDAEVAEVVDASVSKTDGDLPRAGSIPAFGTGKQGAARRVQGTEKKK